MHTHTSLTDLSDDALIARTKSLVQNERSATAALVQHLAEMETRRLHLAEGYSSLFRYCMKELHLSEFATYTRIAAARAGRRFPILFDLLDNGDLHLSAVDVLAPHLTEENHRDLLERARHRSKREVEKIVAEVAPKPPVAATVRRLPALTEPTTSETENATTGLLESIEPATPDPQPAEPTPNPAPCSVTNRAARTRVEPLSPEHYKIQFTADPATVELLRKAQDLLRHQIPNGDPAAIFAMAMVDLVRKLEKRKAAETARPRTSKSNAAGAPSTRNTRHIPAAVRRDVWRRDQGQCAFRSGSGRRCAETGHLEFHHVKPFARGGRATSANIELRCRAHNGYEAVKEFGGRSASIVREKETFYWSRDQLAGRSVLSSLGRRRPRRLFPTRSRRRCLRES